ncbi:MAG: hybrid sensor histidine kinase/response regulator [Pseudomonadota bacterium]
MTERGVGEIARGAVTILYVDDEELARKYFVHAVPERDVLCAAGVDEAIAILEDPASCVGVVVSDYRMPGKMGSELLRHVEQQHPHIVRILVTAFADKGTLLDTVNGGEIFRILEKPLELHRLRETLRLALERAQERMVQRQRLTAIDETLAFLAHELNTPLAAISNFARGIERRSAGLDARVGQPDAGAQVAEAACLVRDNARYCMSVLASFVTSVRRINAAPAPGARAGASARQLIMDLLDTYPLAAPQRALIAVDVRRDFAVTAAPNCVALVLSSLLSNGLRALEGHREPKLRFTVQGGEQPQIRVSDNGPGIAPTVRERLLVDPVTMHADSGGSGWGLIFCKRIMQSFGGNIEVQSEQGRSTTIALNFPALKKE